MAGAVRLNNGATVQLRVGVLQGIGPIGPRGLQGVQGEQGEQGVQGETGPTGGIINYMGRSHVGTSNSMAASTDVNLSFDALDFDDFSAYTATTWTLTSPGDYAISAFVDWTPNGTAAGARNLWLVIAGTAYARQTTAAVASSSIHTYQNINWPIRITGSTTVRVYARSTDTATVSIAAGAVSINRIGSGSPGPVGPQGAQGAVGASGPQGPQGIPGNSSSGYTRFDDLW